MITEEGLYRTIASLGSYEERLLYLQKHPESISSSFISLLEKNAKIFSAEGELEIGLELVNLALAGIDLCGEYVYKFPYLEFKCGLYEELGKEEEYRQVTQEIIAFLEEEIEVYKGVDLAVYGQSLMRLGIYELYLKNYEKATNYFSLSKEAYLLDNQKTNTGRALYNMGLSLEGSNNLLALLCYLEGYDLCLQEEDRKMAIDCIYRIAILFRYYGERKDIDYETSLRNLEQSLKLSKQSKNYKFFDIISHKTFILSALMRKEANKEPYLMYLDLARDLDYRYGLMNFLLWQGKIYQYSGLEKKACETFQEVIDLSYSLEDKFTFPQFGEFRLRAVFYKSRLKGQFYEGRGKETITYLGQSHGDWEWQDKGIPHFTGKFSYPAAENVSFEKELERFKDNYLKTLPLKRRELIDIYLNLGILGAVDNDVLRFYYMASKQMDLKIAKIREPYDLNNIASAYLKRDLPQKGLPYALEAVEKAKIYDDKMNVISYLTTVAAIYNAMQDSASALLYFNEALQLAIKLKLNYEVRSTLDKMKFFYEKAGDWEQTAVFLQMALGLAKPYKLKALAYSYLTDLERGCHKEGKPFDKSFFYLTQINEIEHKRSQTKEIVLNLQILEELYKEIGKEKEALFCQRAKEEICRLEDISSLSKKVDYIIKYTYLTKEEAAKFLHEAYGDEVDAVINYYKEAKESPETGKIKYISSDKVKFICSKTEAEADEATDALITSSGDKIEALMLLRTKKQFSDLLQRLVRTRRQEMNLENFPLSYFVGKIYYYLGKVDKAVGYLEAEIILSKGQGDFRRLKTAYNDLGRIYQEKGDFAKSLEYFLAAVKAGWKDLLCHDEQICLLRNLANILHIMETPYKNFTLNS